MTIGMMMPTTKNDEQHDGDQRACQLAQTDRGGASALAADGGVGLAGADELLVDEHRQMEAMQIIRIAMANAVWVFWDLLFMYSWLDRVTKLTGEPR